MTERVHALTVVLDKDMRVDDVEFVADAIRMLRHVLEVRLEVADVNEFVVRSRVANEISVGVLEVLNKARG